MAFRGRGRGRGRGRDFDNRQGKKVPYILFPEDVVLPSLPNINPISEEETRLISSKFRLEHFWLGSCYHLNEESFTKLKEKSKGGKGKSSEISESKEDVEIERYSDRLKQRTHAKREALESYLKQTPLNFPPELIQGARRSQRATKKLRWDRNLGVKEFDALAKLEEEESKDEDGKKAKERESKENESGDEEGEEKGEEDEEYSDDGDYNQNIDFDDDEDDMNMEEEIVEDYYE